MQFKGHPECKERYAIIAFEMILRTLNYQLKSYGIMYEDSPENRSLKMVMAKLSKSKSAATSLNKIKHKISKRQKSHEKSTKRDQLKHKWLLQKGKLADGTKVSYNYQGEVLKTGCTKGDKICCNCCETELSPSMFERHAGRTNTKKPYQNIFLEKGMSLREYSSYLKLNGQKSGNLLSCENRPGSFHEECQLSIILPEPNAVQNGKVSEVSTDGRVSEAGSCECDKFRGLWSCEKCCSKCSSDTWKGFCTCPSCIGSCSCERLLGFCVCERWKDPWNCYESGFDYTFSEFNL